MNYIFVTHLLLIHVHAICTTSTDQSTDKMALYTSRHLHIYQSNLQIIDDIQSFVLFTGSSGFIFPTPLTLSPLKPVFMC